MQSWILQFLVIVCGGICLCMLGVVDIFMMFTSWDSLEPIRYGMRNLYVGCRGLFVASGSIVCH